MRVIRAAVLHYGERRPWALSLLLAVFAVVSTAAVAVSENLPIRDPDGIAGSPLVRLTAILVLFWCLDVLPRAAGRSGWNLATFPIRVIDVARERWTPRRIALVLLGLFSFYACYVGYRNLKGFLPFVRPELHDGALLHFEERLFGGNDPSVLLRDALGTGTAAHVLSIIYVSYLAFVPLSLGAALVWSSNVRRGLWYATALNLNWLLGVGSYYLVPTLGPVYAIPERYAGLPDTAAGALQTSLLEARREVLSLGPHATDAVQSIAGFASLHVSVVVSAVLLLTIARAPRLVRVAAWAYLLLIALSTMYLGWHYAVDDVGGIIIGLLAFWLAGIATGHDVGEQWRAARRRRATARARTSRRAAHPVLEGAVNVPNALSLARILIVPVLVAIIVASPEGSLVACALFAAGALTDVLDGHIARSRGLITPLGKVFDPLADKLLVVGALASLVIVDRLPWWVVAVILGREVLVTVMRSSAARRGRYLPADGLGKVKMGLQVAMVLVLLAVPDPGAPWVTVLVAATVAATVGSGARYAARWRKLAAADQSIADQT